MTRRTKENNARTGKISKQFKGNLYKTPVYNTIKANEKCMQNIQLQGGTKAKYLIPEKMKRLLSKL